MSTCAVVGINWGDEGKGRMVDYFADNFNVVVRYQGGGNAGHTVVNEYGKFALHLLPSGIFNKNTVNVIGNGVALDAENLLLEIEGLKQKGVEITPNNLKISSRASLLLPIHRKLDELEELRLKDKKYGSTKQGIAPFYADKYRKKTVMIGEYVYSDNFAERITEIVNYENLAVEGIYKAEPFKVEEILEWANKYVEAIKPYVCDTEKFLQKAYENGSSIMFEAQLGALRDLDFGIYPYTTSSNTLSSYAPVGSGLTTATVDNVIGVVKAYSTCVGEGPFVCELLNDEGEELRVQGQEYGAKTGRPRRVGPIDIVATAYGVKMQNAKEIALTKLDVLSFMDKIPVCTAYEIDGKVVKEFPFQSLLNKAKPVIEYLDGFKCDISKVRKYEDLPENARKYVEYIENNIGAKIKYVSVGPERESLIVRD